jgi:hypothetical protein
MCGDFREGMQLALGIALPDENAEGLLTRDRPDVDEFVATERELDELTRQGEERDARISELPTARFARIYASRAGSWLKEHRPQLIDAGDAVLKEALEIVAWDACLVPAKLHRAQCGRDAPDEGLSDDPVQSDWNGSAKVVLISLERSEAAWRVIADVVPDRESATLLEIVGLLRRRVAREFPEAKAFVRPGFDEPWPAK